MIIERNPNVTLKKYLFFNLGCEYDSTCLLLNERKKKSLCIEYQCQKNGMEYGVKLVKGGKTFLFYIYMI
jgi:hypothetical protein